MKELNEKELEKVGGGQYSENAIPKAVGFTFKTNTSGPYCHRIEEVLGFVNASFGYKYSCVLMYNGQVADPIPIEITDYYIDREGIPTN